MPHIKRSIRIEGDIAFVTLTQGYEATIDAADAELIGRWNWRVLTYGGTCYAARDSMEGGVARTIRMHRFLLAPSDDDLIDHIDCNGLNNRRCNLRLADKYQNASNRGLMRTNTSGFKGVSWSKTRGKWHAKFGARGVLRSLGYYQTAVEAHEAYKAAASAAHGSFWRES